MPSKPPMTDFDILCWLEVHLGVDRCLIKVGDMWLVVDGPACNPGHEILGRDKTIRRAVQKAAEFSCQQSLAQQAGGG